MRNSHDDLLIEIGTEELPPKLLKTLAEAFAHGMEAALTASGFSFETRKHYATPRRLAVFFTQVAEKQPDKEVERRGPALAAAFDKDGKPTLACQGFAKSCGVSVDQLTTLETDKGSWVIVRQFQAGKTLAQLLPEMFDQAVKQLPFTRPMRWGNLEEIFSRPVHWLTVLYGQEVIPLTRWNCRSDHYTYGHRYHHPQALLLNKAADYEQVLEEQGWVIPDFASRRWQIEQQIKALASAQQAHVLLNENLLEEVTSIVEWPVALFCQFDKQFLEVPPEAIITSLQDHQRCFGLTDATGQLFPYFITVANLQSADTDQVIHGNERVVRARLSDAAFFYHTDRKQPLAARLPLLQHVTFQAKLGNMQEKAQRLARLSSYIAGQLGLNIHQAERAGELAKADLLTEMVGEFPELQGIMGYYYALHDGEPEEVAIAIKEHYLPRTAGDQLPQTPLGIVTALADRLDTLAGIFAIGQTPSGDKDPFGLRRSGIGLLRIVLEHKLDLDILELIQQALQGYTETLQNPSVIENVRLFLLERMRAWYLERDVAAEIINAVFARQLTKPYDMHLRINAVQTFSQLPEAMALAAANKRVSNILNKENFTGKSIPINEALLQEPSEQALYQSLKKNRQAVAPLLTGAAYTEAMQQLAELRKPVDVFFEQVMVMVEDNALRNNRLALLNELRNLFLEVADISLLPNA